MVAMVVNLLRACFNRARFVKVDNPLLTFTEIKGFHLYFDACCSF